MAHSKHARAKGIGFFVFDPHSKDHQPLKNDPVLSFKIPIKLNLIQKQAKARYNQKFFNLALF
ncbi:hypothetical protein VN1249_05330 [Helicobacter pylori]|nr:hypothetical protein VN0390_09570 [Helicobacter pylori]GHR20090.1 hypothetical protein VN1249_05330 [Helicobacter pylori]